MEYFIEIDTYKKTHNLRVIAQVVFGDEEEADEEEGYYCPQQYDRIEVEEVYVYNESSERQLAYVSEELLDIIKEKIIKEEIENGF